MTRLLALVFTLPILIASATAHADGGRGEKTTAMTPVLDAAAACGVLRGKSIDAKIPCTTVSKLTVKGVGNVEVVSAVDSGMAAYAVLVTADGKLWMSAPLELALSNCGMQKCDLIDSHKPKAPRALKTTSPAVAIEFPIKAHHEHTDDSSGKAKQVTTERWETSSILTCGVVGGKLTCAEQSWGGRFSSCKATLSDTGQIKAACTATENVPF